MTRMRADLLALTDDSLISLANRGIFKRAVKENASAPPALTEDADGTVRVRFADGIETTLPPGATLEAAPCGCGATSVCRHRVMAVLAYRDGSPAAATADDPDAGPEPSSTTELDPEPAAAQPPWSPGEFTDDQLKELLGTRAFTAARRAHRAGYRATVCRATASDPVASVELSAVTVRFLVPGDLGYARADAARGARTDAIALAVWAFRTADAADAQASRLEVSVGASADGSGAVAAAASVRDPLTDLLNDGVAHAGPALPAVFGAAQRTLDQAGARWPHDALTDLLDQLAAYRDRSARHDPLHTAALMTELVARHRAASRSAVTALGTEEAAQTPLRHLRLTGLGARVTGDDESRGVEIYLAHHDARLVLALRHDTTIAEGAEPPSAASLGNRRTGAARLRDLAAGNVVTESAVRSANRSVRLANSRVARTSVLPSAGDWSTLPPELLLTDLDAESARLAALPPALIRPRVHGESVRAVVVTDVTAVHYLPGDQRLEATLHAPAGTVTLSHAHSGVAPGAVDALAHLLAGESGPVRYVAGALRRVHGRLVLDPTAVVTGDTVHVPCFATADTALPPTTHPDDHSPLTAAVTAALALTAEVPHRGVRHLPPSWFTRAAESAATLRRLGLPTAAATLTTLHESLSAPTPPTPLDTWATTHLRLLLTADQL
ncbi:hypothetical protein [Nocardia sp. NPDC057668]|uniref:hypothetical protein n=1 Tax=Nocardia sp. NPDC057668 TaxID=3346202 RepID=UPI00366B19ED